MAVGVDLLSSTTVGAAYFHNFRFKYILFGESFIDA